MLPLTPRALALALKNLQADGPVSRTVTEEDPPHVRYATTRVGRPIAAAARDLG
jgi:DNA-binding HxlR family transcriptional regulator